MSSHSQNRNKEPKVHHLTDDWNGALLINKHAGISSFGVIEELQRSLVGHYQIKRRDLPKLGHGGTIDPFATGLLVVCVGRAVKLARYFLGGTKSYEGLIRFGETTVPGDPTDPVSERSEVLPESRDQVQSLATALTKQDYLQKPPMHSAKKKDGKPLYELARQGIEVERESKLCRLFDFKITHYEKPRAGFHLTCSSGTYVRALAQDLGKLMGSVAMLDSLNRTASGAFELKNAWTLDQIEKSLFSEGRQWPELPCWLPFDRMLNGYDRAAATPDEAQALLQGRQNVLFNILKRVQSRQELPESVTHPIQGQDDCLAIYQGEKLIAVARRQEDVWGIERVFT